MSDRLIDLVRKHPVLYDMRNKEMKNKDKKDLIWGNIAAELHIKNGRVAKAKWRNIRDSYVKYLKAIRNPNDGKKYANWPWAEHMNFIRPFVDIPVKAEVKLENDLSENDDGSDMPHDYSDYIEVPLQMNHHNENYSSSRKFIGNDYNFDAEDLLFLSYAQTLKTFTKRRQAEIKKQVCLLMNKAEMEHLEELAELNSAS